LYALSPEQAEVVSCWFSYDGLYDLRLCIVIVVWHGPTVSACFDIGEKVFSMNGCSACKYFYDGPGEIDECRRFPPVLFRRPSGEDFAFPNTTVSDWCGEFSSKKPGARAEKSRREPPTADSGGSVSPSEMRKAFQRTKKPAKK